MRAECCPTCGRPLEDELVRSTALPAERAHAGEEWKLYLAELVELVRTVVEEAAGPFTAAEKRERERARMRARRAHLRGVA